jgi:hypothetical protein
MLIAAFEDLLDIMYLLNRKADFEAHPTIEAFVAANCSRLTEEFGFMTDMTVKRMSYHSFSLKTGICSCIDSATRLNKKLKSKLVEFDKVYRGFEEALIYAVSSKKLFRNFF